MGFQQRCWVQHWDLLGNLKSMSTHAHVTYCHSFTVRWWCVILEHCDIHNVHMYCIYTYCMWDCICWLWTIHYRYLIFVYVFIHLYVSSIMITFVFKSFPLWFLVFQEPGGADVCHRRGSLPSASSGLPCAILQCWPEFSGHHRARGLKICGDRVIVWWVLAGSWILMNMDEIHGPCCWGKIMLSCS